ncbi:MAG: c-type cytochrome [Myxococcales bacterium]|nr:c-type cytochrome [Myxococcales bacterium]
MQRARPKTQRAWTGPWALALFVLTIVGGCATLSSGTGPAEYPRPEPLWEEANGPRVSPSPELAARGRELFHIRCAGCHGLGGEGDGPAASLMQDKPRDLTEGVFKFRSTLKGTMPRELDLFRTITAGFPAYGMPSFRYLSAAERWALVDFVKSQSPEWEAVAAGEPVEVGQPGARSGEALARGRQLFVELKCTDCHRGPEGEPPKNPDIKDDWGRPIQARDYRKGPLYFKAGGRPRDIARVVLTGIPGTPMGSYAEQIKSRDDLWALAHFVHSLSAEGAANPNEEAIR